MPRTYVRAERCLPLSIGEGFRRAAYNDIKD